jgi:hypothetical protein
MVNYSPNQSLLAEYYIVLAILSVILGGIGIVFHNYEK